jgi:hypothetical protein
MGPMTALATITTGLLVALVAIAVVMLGIGLAVVLPQASTSRSDRRARHLSIPAYYLTHAAA